MHTVDFKSLSITIHDDYCADVCDEEIESILVQIAALICDAIVRNHS